MDCVNIICNKYNIDKTDAVRELTDQGIKLKTSIKHFPWNGVPDTNCCQGIKFCGGLFLQCKNKKDKDNENYCSFCSKQSEQNEHNKPNCGNVQDRMLVPALDYVDPKGRKVMPFSTYMKKKNIDRDLAEIEANMKNINIEEEQFIEVVVRRGRPKKNQSNQEAPKAEKRRGRPKKETQTTPPPANPEPTTDQNTDNTENVDNTDNTDENTDNVDNTDENTNENKECEEANERGEHDEDESMGSDNNDSEDASEIEVETFEYMGTEYLRSDTGEIYNKETHDMMGNWNNETKEIDFIHT